MLDGFIDAHNLRVGLCAHEASKAVAGVATDATAFVRVSFIKHYPDWNMEGFKSRACEVVGQLLNARLMADGGPGIGRVGRRFGRIFPTIAVHLVEILGLRVVGLEI